MKNYSLIALSTVALAVVLTWYFWPSTAPLFGSDSGALSPGTMADDATVGSVAWTTVDNAKVEDGSVSNAAVFCGAGAVLENSVKIVKGDTITGDEKSTGATLPNPTLAYVSYGGAADLWGTTWTADDINGSTFGVVFSVVQNGTSHYLKATNFGFSIPAGATIDGILVEIKQASASAAPC